MPLNLASENLLNSLSTAIVVVNDKLKIEYANHSAQSLFEVSAKHLLGVEVGKVISDSSIRLKRLYQTLQDGQGFSDAEVSLVFNDGRHTKADITVTLQDIAEQRMLLIELKQIDKQRRISEENQHLAQQQAARELIRGLAHEIKNPLGGIRGAAQLLQKSLSLEHQDFTKLIIEQSDRLRNLVDRLLGPNALPAFRQYNIHQILEQVRAVAELDNAKGIIFKRDYDPSIPEFFMDADMIQQALLNIVRNAVQAINDAGQDNGTITMGTRIERQMTIQRNRYNLVAQITITDNGPGIPNELRDTLFYPMITGKKDGSGLGLSISQTLVNHHQGRIDVDSWPGYTEFVLHLPITHEEKV